MNAVPGLAEDTTIVMFHDLLRPWMLITKIYEVRAAIALMAMSIYKAARIFYFFFAVIIIAAITVNIMFYKKFDPQLGDTVDGFLETFINMFIFMTSGENWVPLASLLGDLAHCWVPGCPRLPRIPRRQKERLDLDPTLAAWRFYFDVNGDCHL